jgi:hypothetical protein
MIDQSHNLKDPLEDLIQSTEASSRSPTPRRCSSIVTRSPPPRTPTTRRSPQRVLQQAYRTDVRPLVAEARRLRARRWIRSGPTGGWAIDGGGRRARLRGPGRRPGCEPTCRRGGGRCATAGRGGRLRRVVGPRLRGRPRPTADRGGAGAPSRAHAPVRHPDGSLRWDWARLVAEARLGCHERWTAGRSLRSASTPGASTTAYSTPWRVGRPSALATETVASLAGNGSLTASVAGSSTRTTGIQLMAGNTIFQLAAHDRDESWPGRDISSCCPSCCCPRALRGRRWPSGRPRARPVSSISRRVRGTTIYVRAVGADQDCFPEITPTRNRGRHPRGRPGLPHQWPRHGVRGARHGFRPFAVGRVPVRWHPVPRRPRAGSTPETGDDLCFERNLSNEPGALGGNAAPPEHAGRGGAGAVSPPLGGWFRR